MQEKVQKKKKMEFPHILVLLLGAVLIAAILTWIIPAGQYQRVLNESSGRMVVDPESFNYVDRTPVGLFGAFIALEEGLIQAGSITFLIFAAFSAMYILEKSGALDAAVVKAVQITASKPALKDVVIVILMIILSAWGSTGTMSFEEIIAFIPIFIALCIALGYDSLVAIGISVVPVGVGFASATVNPFTIGVAQTIAELPMFSGLTYRLIILAVMTLINIVFVLMYARKIKADPSKSLVAGIDYSDLSLDDERMKTEMTLPRKLSLLALLVGILVMAYGLIKKGWYINEVAAIFMMISIAVGIFNKWSPNQLAGAYVEGLSKGVLSAVVVGFARGILVVLTKGQVLDTIVHAFATWLQSLSLYGRRQVVVEFLLDNSPGRSSYTPQLSIRTNQNLHRAVC